MGHRIQIITPPEAGYLETSQLLQLIRDLDLDNQIPLGKQIQQVACLVNRRIVTPMQRQEGCLDQINRNQLEVGCLVRLKRRTQQLLEGLEQTLEALRLASLPEL